MQNIITPITLDLSVPGPYLTVYGMQGDRNSRSVTINLTDKGIPYELPDSVTARLMGRRADGKAILEDCTISGSSIICGLSEYLLGSAGIAECKIGLFSSAGDSSAVSSSGRLLSSISFKVKVEENPFDESQVLETPEFSALTNALTRVDPLLTGAEEALGQLEIVFTDWTLIKQDADEKLAEMQRLGEEAAALAEELSDSNESILLAESLRSQQETDRKTQEIKRQEQESAREAAEALRKSKLEQALADTADAVSAAASASLSAGQSAQKADTAAEKAVSSSSRAELAAEAASGAAETANEAAALASSSVAHAETAASSASAAASSAEQAAVSASSAADRANQAADEVQGIITEGGVVTPTERSAWNEASLQAHRHTNQETLDGITSEQVAAWTAGVPLATYEIPGKVKPDGTSITVDADGTLHGADTVPLATTEHPGKVMPDGITITVDETGKIAASSGTEVIRLESYEQWLEMKESGQLKEGVLYYTDTASDRLFIDDTAITPNKTYSSEKIMSLIQQTQLSASTGMQAKQTVFQENGTILETYSEGTYKETLFQDDGTILEHLYTDGTLTVSKATAFLNDGTIKEVLLLP